MANHRHHLFSNTKKNREIYGKLLDEPFNIVYLCVDCHLSKSIPKYTEAEFRTAAILEGGHAGHELPQGSKAFQFLKM
jgi:5-methylcytosine-specific restriction endonuclease McrA